MHWVIKVRATRELVIRISIGICAIDPELMSLPLALHLPPEREEDRQSDVMWHSKLASILYLAGPRDFWSSRGHCLLFLFFFSSWYYSWAATTSANANKLRNFLIAKSGELIFSAMMIKHLEISHSIEWGRELQFLVNYKNVSFLALSSLCCTSS